MSTYFEGVFSLCSVQSLSHVWLCNPMDCSTPGFPVHHQLPKLAHTHVHQVGDAIQPSHPLLSPSPPAFNLSQHQGLFQGVSSSHQVANVLELQHEFFQWIFRTDFLKGRTGLSYVHFNTVLALKQASVNFFLKVPDDKGFKLCWPRSKVRIWCTYLYTSLKHNH